MNRLIFCCLVFCSTLATISLTATPVKSTPTTETTHLKPLPTNTKSQRDFLRVATGCFTEFAMTFFNRWQPVTTNFNRWQPITTGINQWDSIASNVNRQNSFSYPSFGSEFLDKQIELYLRFIATYGVPDILIIGSSRGAQGVDPQALETALASRGYAGVKIFNFGINGATAQVIDLVLRKILTPEQLPRMIIWADGSRAFNSGRNDRTYNAILSSPGYQRLSAGIRPNLKPTENNKPAPNPTKPPANNPPPTPTPSTAPNPPLRRISPPPDGLNADPINFLPDTPANPSASEENYPVLLAGSKQLKPQDIDREKYIIGGYLASANTEFWNDKATDTLMANRVNLQLMENGFNAVSTRFNPANYYQRFPRVAGQYDGDYANFNLQGEQSNALRSVATFAKSRRIALLLVNLPLTQDYLDPARLKHEKLFQQFMWNTAGATGFMFRDLSRLWLTKYEYFADPSHLNQFGAEVVAQQIAADTTLPWQVVKE